MGFVQKDALRTAIISYLGLLLGYLNKGVLFILILTTGEIGLMNLVVSVGLLFAQLSNLGTINAIAKFLPFFRDHQGRKQSFFLLNIGFVVTGILLFTLIVFLLKGQITNFYSKHSALFVEYYFWIIPIGIANVFFIIFETYLRAIFKNILSIFLYEFVLRLLISILLVLLWFKVIDFDRFFVLHALVYFIPTLILLIYMVKIKELSFNKSKLNTSKKFKRIMLSFSLFSYSNSVGILLIATLDSLMIAQSLGLEETGVYTMILYLASALQIPYKSLMRIANPLIPQYWKEKSIEKIQDLYQKTSSISLIIGLYLFLMVWCNITNLFTFLPKEYLPGIWVFLFIMIGRIIDMYFGLNGWILVTSKKIKFDVIFTVILLFLVFVLNYWLIPIYGIIGVAIATGTAMIVYNLCRMIFVLRAYKIHPFEKNQFYIVLLFFGLLLLFMYLPISGVNKYVSIVFNSSIITLVFLGTIITMKWNRDLNDYLQKVKAVLLKKATK